MNKVNHIVLVESDLDILNVAQLQINGQRGDDQAGTDKELKDYEDITDAITAQPVAYSSFENFDGCKSC